MDLVARVVARYRRASEPESTQLAQKVLSIIREIEKLKGQAAKAEAAGQRGKADNLRSKIRDLKGKLDLAESDYGKALWQEGREYEDPRDLK